MHLEISWFLQAALSALIGLVAVTSMGILVYGLRMRLFPGFNLLPKIAEDIKFLRDGDIIRQQNDLELRQEVSSIRWELKDHISLPRHKNGKVKADLSPNC